MKNFYIGADVSKKTLDLVLYDADKEKMRASHIKITNDKKGVDELIKWMKEHKIVKSKAIVCMEYTGKYSFCFAELLETKKMDFVLVPALKIKRVLCRCTGQKRQDRCRKDRCLCIPLPRRISAVKPER